MNSAPTSKKSFSVRSKIFLTVIVSVIALSASIYVISSEVLLQSYVQIEHDGVVQDLRRVDDAIGEFSHQQTIKLRDWAQWDDAYNYALKPNKEFEESSVLPTGLVNIDISSMAFLNLQGKIYKILAVDLATEEEISSADIAARIESEKQLAIHENLDSSAEGLVMLADGPLIISSLPIKKTDGSGPSTGTLIFARFLDDTRIQEIGDITHLSVALFRYDDAALPADVTRAKDRLTKDNNFFVSPVSPTEVDGYSALYDINGNPILIVKIQNPRPVYSQGLVTFYLFMAIGGIAVLLFGIVMVLLLERIVISRFVRLSRDVEKVNDVHDLSMRVQSSVKDEIGMLADKINQMLSWLSEAREAETSSRREIVNLLDELKKGKEQAEEMARLLAAMKGGKS
jgi:sensor domain CHASE-containing protein